MLEPFIIKQASWEDGGKDFAPEARARRKASFPGRSARRLTHLGMLLTLCIRKLEIRESVPLLYASAFAESCSLEHFIDSFPSASPMLFQTSIHPSAVEQALIPSRRAVSRFYPITTAFNLAGHALECAAALEDGGEVNLMGGEERGTWLCPFGLASERSFAFGLSLTREGEGIGEVRFEKSLEAAQADGIDLWDLYEAIRDRRAIRLPSAVLESWIQIKWR